MRAEVTHDPAAFWDRAQAWLATDPVRNSVLLVNLERRRTGVVTDPAPATWALVRDDEDQIVAAAMRTPPGRIVLSDLPIEAVAPLVSACLQDAPDAAGVLGFAGQAEAFARAWSDRAGTGHLIASRHRVHTLDRVDPPRPVPGGIRPAGPEDRNLLITWSEAFVRETGGMAISGPAAEVDRRLAAGHAGSGTITDLPATSGPVSRSPAW